MDLREEMDVWIRKDEHAGMHFHPDIELYFVVDGAYTITLKDTVCHLKKDDFMLVNSGMEHSVNSDTPGAVLCCVKYACRCVSEMLGKETTIFFCNSVLEQDTKYPQLRRCFHELVYSQVQRPHKSDCLKRSLLYRILDLLLEYFRKEIGVDGADYTDDVKMMQIYQYVNQNFQDSVSLTELAEKLYISKSALSRFFKKQTGIYFADYLNQVRLRYAMEDLLYTRKNITRIATDCGFSNPSAFNKAFREMYGVTPTEYRADQSKREAAEKQEREDLADDLRAELKEKLLPPEQADTVETEAITVDLRQGSPFPKTWAKCINIGSAYNLSIANLQYHTLYLKDQLGFQYVRIWSIFSTKLMISDGRTKGYYNYDRIDVVLDFLVSNQLIPFLDFGNRPDTALFDPGNPVFCDTEYIPFVSKEIWQDLLSDFILHITNRYGVRETSRWIYEFSCDTAHLPERNSYEDARFNYFDAFFYAYRTIKGYLPEAKVGGPMSEVELDYSFVADFLTKCNAAGCRPDFVSFMLFPYHTRNRTEEITTERAESADVERDQVELMHTVMRENGAADCALFISEWNNSLSNRNYLNDSCCRAAYTAKKISQIADRVDLISVWMASDWMSSYFDTARIANGGSGILTKDSIRKPVYFALDFLMRMGTTLVQKGENYLLTDRGDGNYYILCFNYKWFAVNYFLQAEGVQDPEQIREIFEDDKTLELKFCLEHIPDGKEYIIKKRTVNEEYGSFLTAWKNFQYDQKLRSSDVKYIRESTFPKMSMERGRADGGCLQVHTTLLPHEIALLHIYEE